MPRLSTSPRPSLRLGLIAAALLLAAPAPSSAQQLYDFGSAFGRAAAVADGRVFVGQPQNVLGPGRVYVYEQGPDGWTESAVLTASDGVPSDWFGRAIAADGESLLVGAPSAADSAGATYFFRRGADGWSEAARVEASPGATMAGSAVALAGSMAATVERTGDREAVRVLRWNGEALVEEAVLTGAPDDLRYGAAIAAIGGDAFEMGGDVLGICGANAEGGAFLEVHVHMGEGEWTSTGRHLAGAPLSQPGGLLSLDPYKECGLAAGEYRFVLGVPLAPGGGGVTVYGIRGAGSALAVEGRFSAPEGAAGRFGTSVAIGAGPTIWAGAPNARGQLGAAARFSLVDGAWDEGAVLTGPGTDFMPVFGLALAAAGEDAVVGSPGNDYGAGTAVTYRASGGAWTETGSLAGEVEGYEAVDGEMIDCSEGSAALFGCDQMDLVSLLPVESLGASRGAMVNDVWGWADPQTGREYAVVGRSEGTSFVDVTNPSNPIYLGQLPKTEGSRGNAWRDVKVIRDHALIVADNAGPHGMQVFDLTRLRDVDPADPPTFEADALYTEIGSSHNLAVNEETGFVYTMANSAGGRGCGSLHIIDMRDPKNPAFAGCYTDLTVGLGAAGQTHDAQCVLYHGPDEDFQGREICFAYSESAVSIGDVTDKDAPVVIGKAVMPNTAYIHQGWLTEDQRYMYVNDELDEMNGLTDGTRTMIWDVQDLTDPVLAGTYVAEVKATDHNLYVAGNYMYQSNYSAGLRVLDVTDPENPREVAWFDTAPYADDDHPGFFDGSWSNYPFFPSGNILVTSHKQGLFIVRRTRPIS